MKNIDSSGTPFQWWERALYTVFSWVFTVPTAAAGRILRLLKGRSWAAAPDPAVTKRLLIVQVEHLGDFLIAAGFFRAARDAFPHAHITVIVDRTLVDLVKNFPYFDEVVGFDQSGSKIYRLFAGPVRAFALARHDLWNRRFDLVLNQRWDVDAKHGAVLGMFALGRYHLGFSSRTSLRRQVINRGIEAMYTHALDSRDYVHDGLRGGQLLSFLKLPSGELACEIFVTRDDERFALAQMEKIGSGPLVTLGIGANLKRRQWPILWYVDIAQWVLAHWTDAKFLVVGNAADAADAERLRDALGDRLYNYAGKCSFGQSTALLRHAILYFGTESGPMHMSAAQGVPVVTFFCLPVGGPPDHPNSPVRYAPVGTHARVLQPAKYLRPCSYGCVASEPHCVTGVTIEAAKVALSEFLIDPKVTRTA